MILDELKTVLEVIRPHTPCAIENDITQHNRCSTVGGLPHLVFMKKSS